MALSMKPTPLHYYCLHPSASAAAAAAKHWKNEKSAVKEETTQVYLYVISEMSTFMLFSLLLLLSSVAAALAASVPALFAFGDSLADDGNNNYLATVAKANFPPYGSQFDTGKPTGRFTNGRNQIDYLASKLGLPLIPPYLDPSTKGERLLNGVNFASAGSGILDFTNINAGQLIPMSQQVKNFAKVKQEIVGIVGSGSATELLSKSLFCIFTGNNDFTMTYPVQYAIGGASSRPKFQNLLVSRLLEQIREIYNLGARKFVVAAVGPVGCAPSMISRYNSDGSCVPFLNTPVTNFNTALHSSLSALDQELPDSHIVYSDLFLQMMIMIQNPAPYGIKYVNEACCETFKRIQSCVPGARVCKDVSEFYFWDAYHPSSKVCSVLVDMLYSNGPPYNYPISVEKLVRL